MASNVFGAEQPKRQTKQRVDGLTRNIQRSNTGRRTHRKLLLGVFDQVGEQGRLACAGTTGHENVGVLALDVIEKGELLI